MSSTLSVRLHPADFPSSPCLARKVDHAEQDSHVKDWQAPQFYSGPAVKCQSRSNCNITNKPPTCCWSWAIWRGNARELSGCWIMPASGCCCCCCCWSKAARDAVTSIATIGGAPHKFGTVCQLRVVLRSLQFQRSVDAVLLQLQDLNGWSRRWSRQTSFRFSSISCLCLDAHFSFHTLQLQLMVCVDIFFFFGQTVWVCNCSSTLASHSGHSLSSKAQLETTCRFRVSESEHKSSQ